MYFKNKKRKKYWVIRTILMTSLKQIMTSSGFFASTCSTSLGAQLRQVSRQKHKKWGSYGGEGGRISFGSEEPPKGPVLIGLRSRKFLRALSKQKLFIWKAFKIIMIMFHYAS